MNRYRGLRSRPARVSGFSLVELAIVVAVFGLMCWGGVRAYSPAMESARELARAQGVAVRSALLAFALNNGRLPCPDRDGSGFESGDGNGCASGVQTGWVPYRSIGLAQPDTHDRYAYGVYRNAGASADLTATALPLSNLLTAVQTAQTQSVSTSYVYLTGDNGALGTVDCSGNVVSNPAFVIVAPLEDRDADGNVFDGVHAALPDSDRCFQAAATPATLTQDDVVVSESLSALLGWLAARAS